MVTWFLALVYIFFTKWTREAQSMLNFFVVGRTAEGNTVYYTGKAGKDFISPQMCDAFEYSSIDRARHRASLLNQGTDLHGVRFIVPASGGFGDRVFTDISED
jgi:hypothetical protein